MSSAAAESGAVSESRHRVPVDGDELAAVITRPTDGNTSRMAMLLHGGPGGQKDGPDNLYADLAQHLAGAGIASVRFDFRGSGESTGSYRDMTIARQVDEIAAVRKFVDAAVKPAAWALVGESFGATIGLASFDPTYRAVVLLWPAIWLVEGAFDSYVTDESLAAAARDGYIDIDGEQIGAAFLAELQSVRDVAAPLDGLNTPVLFVHGDADTEVAYQQSERASHLVSGPVRLVPVVGGDHCLAEPNERKIVYRESVAWLRHHL